MNPSVTPTMPPLFPPSKLDNAFDGARPDEPLSLTPALYLASLAKQVRRQHRGQSLSESSESRGSRGSSASDEPNETNQSSTAIGTGYRICDLCGKVRPPSADEVRAVGVLVGDLLAGRSLERVFRLVDDRRIRRDMSMGGDGRGRGRGREEMVRTLGMLGKHAWPLNEYVSTIW